MQQPIVQDFFDQATNTFSYVVSDPVTKRCAIIDSVLDYDAASATTSTTHADAIIAYGRVQGFEVDCVFGNPCACRSFDCSTVFKICTRWQNCHESSHCLGARNL